MVWAVVASPGRAAIEQGTWYPQYRKLGGLQGRYRRMWRKYNLLPPPGFKLRNGQTVVKRHTYYDMPVLTVQISAM